MLTGLRRGCGKRCSLEQPAEASGKESRGNEGVAYTGMFLEGRMQFGEQGEFEDGVRCRQEGGAGSHRAPHARPEPGLYPGDAGAPQEGCWTRGWGWGSSCNS